MIETQLFEKFIDVLIMPKHYSIDFKNLIVSLMQRGKIQNEIAKICGISKATVQPSEIILRTKEQLKK